MPNINNLARFRVFCAVGEAIRIGAHDVANARQSRVVFRVFIHNVVKVLLALFHLGFRDVNVGASGQLVLVTTIAAIMY